MSANIQKEESAAIPFGLLELDGEGTVLHYSPAREPKRVAEAASIIGRNFFDEVVPVSPVKEFKTRFLRFMAIGDSVQRLHASQRKPKRGASVWRLCSSGLKIIWPSLKPYWPSIKII